VEQVKTNERMAAIFRRTPGLTNGGRDREQEAADLDGTTSAAAFKLSAADLMLHESRQLQQHLLDLTRRLLTVGEMEHRRIGGGLQDQILQTLVGIHIRLLALDRQVSLSGDDLNKHIATVRRALQESWNTLRRPTRAAAVKNEG
jgi:signal transduction histidine kinase